MAKKTGIDSDQIVGREKNVTDQSLIKAEWVTRKITIALPKTLHKDFSEECERRKLSTKGVSRDLIICWLIANMDGITADEYRQKIQDELSLSKVQANEARDKQRNKLSGKQRREKDQAKFEAKKPLPKVDTAYQQPNPHDESKWLLK